MGVRVTDNMTYDFLTEVMLNAQSRAREARERAASGERLSRPSDDPLIADRAVLLDTGLRQLKSMDLVHTRIESELATAENALGGAVNVVTRVRELAVQGANAGLSSTDRENIALEMSALRQNLLGFANTQFDGRYLFGGTLVTTAPFQSNGTFAGNTTIRQVEVAPGVQASANVSGQSAFADPGGQNVFTVIAAIETALNANDPDSVSAQLGNLDTASRQLARGQAQIGVETRRLDTARQIRQDTLLTLSETRLDVVEIDAAESLLDLSRAESALQAAVSQVSSVLGSIDVTLQLL